MGRLKSNRRGWEKLKRRLMNFDQRTVDVGFFKREKYDDQNLYVSEVAWMNDQGTSQVPARPFFTVDFLDYASNNFRNDVRSIIKELLLGKSTAYKKMMEGLGEKYSNSLKEFIYDYPGHNSIWWAEAKGFDDPLYHTGTMVNAVDFRVKKIRE